MYYKIVNKKKKIATIIADLLGYVIWSPVNLFKKNRDISADIKDILIIRAAYIGDVVMTLPVLKPLKELYPKARITFLTGSAAAEILTNNPHVDEVLVYEAFWFYPKQQGRLAAKYLEFLKKLRAKKYDLVIEARADIRNILLLAYLTKARHRVSYSVGGGGYLLTHVVPYEKLKHKVEYHLDIIRFLGANVDKLEWDIYLNSQEKDAVEVLFSEAGIGRANLLVGIHPGGRKPLKCWDMDRFAKVADHLMSEYDAEVIFTGSAQEKKSIDEMIKNKMTHHAVNLAGKTNLRILSGLIDKLNLFICNDSAPLHIASAMNTPTVAVFGASKSKETGPYDNVHRVVEKDLSCRLSCDEDVCKWPTLKECMDAIQVDDVLTAVKDVLEETHNKVNANDL